jgi:hypothetical protein
MLSFAPLQPDLSFALANISSVLHGSYRAGPLFPGHSGNVCFSRGCSRATSALSPCPKEPQIHRLVTTWTRVTAKYARGKEFPWRILLHTLSRSQDASQNDSLRARFHSSQVFLACGSNSTPEHRTLDFHIDLVEWVHNSLNPVLVDLCKEQLDCLLRLR